MFGDRSILSNRHHVLFRRQHFTGSHKHAGQTRRTFRFTFWSDRNWSSSARIWNSGNFCAGFWRPDCSACLWIRLGFWSHCSRSCLRGPCGSGGGACFWGSSSYPGLWSSSSYPGVWCCSSYSGFWRIRFWKCSSFWSSSNHNCFNWPGRRWLHWIRCSSNESDEFVRGSSHKCCATGFQWIRTSGDQRSSSKWICRLWNNNHLGSSIWGLWNRPVDWLWRRCVWIHLWKASHFNSHSGFWWLRWD